MKVLSPQNKKVSSTLQRRLVKARIPAVRRPSTRMPVSGNGAKVAERAMRFVEEKQPYCYGGKNQPLNKSNKPLIEDLEKMYSSSSNFGHILRDDKTVNGDNYKWTMSAESSPYVAIDCSGLTRIAYQTIGIDITAGSKNQCNYGESKNAEVPMSEARVGDLLWRSGHVGIVGENGLTIEAKGWKYGCTYDRKFDGAFTKCFHLTGDDAADGSEPELLTEAQIRSAITYNKKNNQSICTKIQKLVGVTPDGSFGRETIVAIAEWQAANDLEADGKFGPKSKAKAGFA